MNDSAMKIAAPMVKSPACGCGGNTEFEFGEISEYKGKVRVICPACGKTGAWQTYEHFNVSIPQLWDVLHMAVDAYNAI